MTDRKPELQGVPTEPFIEALADADPRVRAQALISLGRLGRAEVAERIVPLTTRESAAPAPSEKPAWNQPDPGRVLPHLAVRALVSLEAADAQLAALDGPHAAGALWALKSMHQEKAVTGLLHRLSTTRDQELRREIITTLVRLYHREGEYKGGWWGTRPDTSGPYYDRQTWEQSDRIAAALRTAFSEADKTTAEHLRAQLARHKVAIDGLNELAESPSEDEPQQTVVIPQVDPNDPNQIANMPAERVAALAAAGGDPQRGMVLFKRQSCIACHTYANGQNPQGPHLVDIGKRYKRSELIESVLNPDAKIAQGFETYSLVLDSGKIVTGFVVSESAGHITVRESNGRTSTIAREAIDERVRQKPSMMPKGLVNNLTPGELADLVAYLESLH